MVFFLVSLNCIRYQYFWFLPSAKAAKFPNHIQEMGNAAPRPRHALFLFLLLPSHVQFHSSKHSATLLTVVRSNQV